MAVSASLVKELRERTGLGMMECKKALTETDGDIDVAIENLRKASGLKKSSKCMFGKGAAFAYSSCFAFPSSINSSKLPFKKSIDYYTLFC